MKWYSINSLGVTQNSRVVTGTSTQFVTFIYPGFGIFIDGVGYEIDTVDSPTQLTLAKPYLGVTKSNALYSIWPTQALNGELWAGTLQLVEEFGPLRNNLSLLTQQIADTLGYKNSSSANAIAAATSATNAANSATASATSATNSANSATAAAGSATSATSSKTASAGSATTAANSASDANASKQAAASSASDALTNKNTTNALKDEAVAAKDAAVTAKAATEIARDAAITARGGSEAGRDAAVLAKTASEVARAAAEAARDLALSHKNAAAGSAQAAAISETNAATSKGDAQTAKTGAEAARDASVVAKTGSETARTGSEGARDTAIVAKNDAVTAKNAAEAAAAEAQEPVNAGAIEDALGYVPASSADTTAALNLKANKDGETFTGVISVPAGLIVRSAGTYGGSITLNRGSAQTINGDTTIDASGSSLRVYDSTMASRMLNYDLIAGTLTLNGQTVYHSGNLSKTSLALNNVDNTSDADKPISTATLTALNLKSPSKDPTFTGTVSGITATMVGLGSVNNTTDAAKPVSLATQTALNLKANLAFPAFTGTVTGITATMVGLGNVNNTTDALKPISTATATALATKVTFGTNNINAAYSSGVQLAGNNPSNDIFSPGLQVREVNYIGAGSTDSSYAPGLSFHWSTVAATAIKMYSDGSLRIIAQGSTGGSYQKLFAGDTVSTGFVEGGEMYARSWFRCKSTGGLFWETYGRGINAADVGSNYGNVNVYGPGTNGWKGYSIDNTGIFMANANTRGIYNAQAGHWCVQWDDSGNAIFPANITAFSDERLKRNMRPISDARSRRKGMADAAILYERDGEERIGFGAQTLELTNPEVVRKADDGKETRSVNYMDTVAILAVDATALDDRITALEAENTQLRSALSAFEARLTKAGL
jgi:hypothetical protein